MKKALLLMYLLVVDRKKKSKLYYLSKLMPKIPWEGLWEEGQYKTDLLNHFISHDKNVLFFNTSVNPLVGLSNKLPLRYKELRIKTH